MRVAETFTPLVGRSEGHSVSSRRGRRGRGVSYNQCGRQKMEGISTRGVTLGTGVLVVTQGISVVCSP